MTRAAPPAFVIVPTHTPRYLELVLAGLGRQTHRPNGIMVSCDTDDAAIGDVIEPWAQRIGLDIWWIRRRPHENERLCQVRNNAVRHLVEELKIATGRLIVLDGDMVASDTLVQQHLEMGHGHDLVYPYRADVTQDASRALDAVRYFQGEQKLTIDDEQRLALEKRHRRYVKQKLMRSLGGAIFGGSDRRIAPLYKPKLLGGHFSCTLSLYVKLNGFDELYQGWGFKDDEFAFRAARQGASVRIAVRQIIAWHLWHPTRQPDRPMRELPTAARFARRRELPDVCEHGIRNPLPQHPVDATRFPGSQSAGWEKPAPPAAEPASAHS